MGILLSDEALRVRAKVTEAQQALDSVSEFFKSVQPMQQPNYQELDKRFAEYMEAHKAVLSLYKTHCEKANIECNY